MARERSGGAGTGAGAGGAARIRRRCDGLVRAAVRAGGPWRGRGAVGSGRAASAARSSGSRRPAGRQRAVRGRRRLRFRCGRRAALPRGFRDDRRSTSPPVRRRRPHSAIRAARSTTSRPTCSTCRASGGRRFDLVVEIMTVQSLPRRLRAERRPRAVRGLVPAPGSSWSSPRHSAPGDDPDAWTAVAAHPCRGRRVRRSTAWSPCDVEERLASPGIRRWWGRFSRP